MRFLFFMNMPSGSYDGPLAHQVIGDIDVSSLEELLELMCSDPFIIVTLMFYERDRNSSTRLWQSKGKMILSTDHIGKVMVYEG